MKIAISMESTCDLPKELIEKYGFEIIPYSVILGDNVVEDNAELPAKIFEYVEKTKVLPKTSAINEIQYKEYFTSLLEKYDSVIHITLSSGLTSSVSHAQTAAEKMKNVYIRIVILALVAALIFPLVLSGCSGKRAGEQTSDTAEERLVIGNAKESMFAGETQKISVYSSQTEDIYNKPLAFKSSDPTVAMVDSTGVITACSSGEAVIYVQSAANMDLKTELKLSVTYQTLSSPNYSIENRSGQIDGSNYPFWSAKGYSARGSNWDIMDIAKILITKGTDDYVFSEAFYDKKVVGEQVLVLSDWGNEDVLLHVDSINSDVFAEIFGKYEFGSGVSIDAITRAIDDFSNKLDSRVSLYKGCINLSDMPSDKEYRVSLVMDYSVVKVKNYYSRGALSGIWQLGSDILKGDIESLMDSYTYAEYEYEIVDCVNVDVLIEVR